MTARSAARPASTRTRSSSSSSGSLRSVLLALAFAGIISGLFLTHRALARSRAGWPSIEERVFVPSPTAARVLSLGYGELAADLAWARTLVYYGDGMDKGYG